MEQDQLVSVIMSIYKEPKSWLDESVNSILSQTYKSLEFIIVLDNPQSESHREYLSDLAARDARVVPIFNEKNLGLAASLNRALVASRGVYVARMDADDVALGERIKRQVEFLESNGDLALCGTSIEQIDEDGVCLGILEAKTGKKLLQKLVKYKSIAFHPTWMFRREVLDKIEGYSLFPVSQDYDFVRRIFLAGYKAGNLEDVLLKYRVTRLNTSFRKVFDQFMTELFISDTVGKGVDSKPLKNMDGYHLYIKASISEKLRFEESYQSYNAGKMAWANGAYFEAGVCFFNAILISRLRRRQIFRNAYIACISKFY